MDALNAIVSKRDTRSYLPSPIDDTVLGRVLQAGRMAGSAKNAQLTRLIVVADPGQRTALTQCGDFTAWIDQAPVVVAFAVPVEGGRLFDIGRMAQNMMVAGHALGLASCAVTFHHQDRIRDVLQLPDDWEAPMGITPGHPGEPDPRRQTAARVALDELVHRERWRG